MAILAVNPKVYELFFLLILAYARKKEWRTLQSKFLLLLFIKVSPIIITYTESMVNSLSLSIIKYYNYLLGISSGPETSQITKEKAYTILVPLEFTV